MLQITKKIKSRKFFDLLLRPMYKDELEQYRQFLCEQYKNVGELIEEEKIFLDDLKGRYPELWKWIETKK